jgi:predicted RNA-binding Zn-ribbon protein involved in translation (DUF1610 family)
VKILLLDIETAPNVAYVWRLRDDFIPTDHLVSSSYVLCVSAAWLDNGKVMFTSIKKDGRIKMLTNVHNWLRDADVVVHYNGKKFDIPNLNREFVEQDMRPPSPYRQVDLYHVVRAQFKFVSNNFPLGVKVKHKGMQLWKECMAGDLKAWAIMEKYNKRDVTLLKKLYKRLLPWINSHPNHAMFLGTDVCPKCGSDDVRKEGIERRHKVHKQRYSCNACGSWFKGEAVKNKKSSFTAY